MINNDNNGNNNNNNGRNRAGLASLIFLATVLIASVIMMVVMSSNSLTSSSAAKETYTYTQFQQDLNDGKVESVTIEQNEKVPTGTIYVTLSGANVSQEITVSDVNYVEQSLLEKQVKYTVEPIKTASAWPSIIMQLIIIGLPILLIVIMMSRQAGGTAGQISGFSKNRARLSNDMSKKVTFKDVAGLKEEKEEMAEIVDFLKDPAKYTRLGAHVPKGVILTGPPGTGKTLMAKAVAGEAGVPFFSISGSDFVEMFVGVGAARVRDMFAEAKKNAPCIIFIDEIDAVARQRGSGLGGGHDEREQTLNQILVEMDGFNPNSGIIVIAATNRIDILDPAILRPGRFDRKIAIGYPDMEARLEILKVHSKKKPLADDVDLEALAKTTVGFTGADLANIMNEAAIAAAGAGRQFILDQDIKNAFIREGIGVEKKSRVVSDNDKRITAYHESGHAILFHVLPDVGPVHMISIIPTGRGAAGYTMPLPENEDLFNTRGKMIQNIMVALGGRIAEEIEFKDVTTGASQDIKQATSIARDMVTKYGFSSELGLIDYAESDELFIGKEIGHSHKYSEQTANKIDEAVKKIIDDCYIKAKQIITDKRDVLTKSAELLLEKEKVSREEFEALFDDNTAEN